MAISSGFVGPNAEHYQAEQIFIPKKNKKPGYDLLYNHFVQPNLLQSSDYFQRL
jgi:hypothetical protein